MELKQVPLSEDAVPHRISELKRPGFSKVLLLRAWTPATNGGLVSLPALPHRTNNRYRNFKPVFHRLRLFGLGLGPDLPWEDEPCPGNLRFTV